MVAVERLHDSHGNLGAGRRSTLLGAALAAFLLAVGSGPVGGQEASLAGTVRDGAVPVFAAHVELRDDAGAVLAMADTDDRGRFALTGLPEGRFTLSVTRIGYADLLRQVTLMADRTTVLELELQPAAVTLGGVRVEATRSRERIQFEDVAGITARTLSPEEVKLVPGIAEADPIRAVEVLPGVVSTSDFSANFNVRGGSADQNLILLDGVPIFSPFHLGGFFSVFNADMVEAAELQSGGFGARHGGRVSSVLTVESDPGDGTHSVDAGISALAARAAVGGSLGEARWRVSARRSYFDALLAPVVEFPYHLQDFQGVVDVPLTRRSRLRVVGYTGDDVLDLTRLDAEDFPLRIQWQWGNDVAGLRWEWRAGDATVGLSLSESRFDSDLRFPDFGDTEARTKVRQGRVAADVSWPVGSFLRLEAGLSRDGIRSDNLFQTGGTVFGEGVGSGILLSGYVQTRVGRPGEWLVEPGVRFDGWNPSEGAGVRELSPRVAVKRFFSDGSWAVKAATGRYTQFLHSIRDEELPLGLDVWVVTGSRAPHVVSDQVQVGVEAFPAPEWTVAADLYHRRFDGVITFNVGDDPNDPNDDFLPGTGASRGLDLFVRRSGPGVSGWASLSILKADRTYPDPVVPVTPAPRVTYPPIFDRRVDLDVVLRLPSVMGWEAGVRLNVGSGTPYTRPVVSYPSYVPRFLEGGGRFAWSGADDAEDGVGDFGVLLGERNRERYPVYHRLDLSLRRTFQKAWGTVTPHLDILNVYNRKNVLFYFFQYDEQPATRSGLSMFPFLPTVGLEISF